MSDIWHWPVLKDSMRETVLGKRNARGSVPAVRSQAQSSSAAPPYQRRPEYPPQTPPYPTGPGLAPGVGPAFGSGGSFLGMAASTAAGVIGGGLLLNSIRSMFGDHAGLVGQERSAFGSASGSAADSDLAHAAGTGSIGRGDVAQKDRDQDQDDQDQEDQDQDQDQDQDFTDDGGDFGGDDTDYA